MQRYQQAAAVLFLFFAVFIVWQGLKLQYYTPLGPGSGFFAVWLGALLGLLALMQLVQTIRPARPATPPVMDADLNAPAEVEPEQVLPDRSGVIRIAAVIGALILTALLLPLLGFQITAFILLIFLLLGLERVRPVTAVIIALVFSVGLFQLLTRFLSVELPHSSLAVLKQLGL
ncbi:tripartite tricarboxylate transporter TctB family protein [Deinococcus deserti]